MWRIPNSGKDIELRFGSDYFEYRYLGTSQWISITPIDDIKGSPAFGLTTSDTTIPATNSTVVVSTNSSSFVSVRSVVLISDGTDSFHGEATAKTTVPPTITVKALGYPNDTSSGATVNNGAVVVVAGIRGEPGSSGTSEAAVNWLERWYWG